jgi:hypothetical protein
MSMIVMVKLMMLKKMHLTIDKFILFIYAFMAGSYFLVEERFS